MEIYRLTIKKDSEFNILSLSNKKKHFTGFASKTGKKIYLVAKNNQIHYVGITNQPMGRRLYSGMNPNHKTGYHGYRFRKDIGKHYLTIWKINNSINSETIEAEIVFLIREKNQWPKHQTEIHFHSTKKEERNLAKKILKTTQELIKMKL